MDKKKKNPAVKLGKVSLPPFKARDVKVRITMFVDADVLDAFKAAARKREPAIGYQTLINEKLRETLPALDKSLADQVAELRKQVAAIAGGRRK